MSKLTVGSPAWDLKVAINEVPKVRTQFAMSELDDALKQVPEEIAGRPKLSAAQRTMVMAIVALEVDHGRSAWCWNVGNILSVYPDRQQWFWMVDTGNRRRFRSYPSLQSGVNGIVQQFRSSSRPTWRRTFDAGNIDAFFRALGGEGGGHRYYEGNPKDPEAYLRAVRQLAGQYGEVEDLEELERAHVRQESQRSKSKDQKVWWGLAAAGAVVGVIVIASSGRSSYG